MISEISTGLLGKSLAHSLSPEIHRLICGADYRLFEIEPKQVEAFVKGDCPTGFNVTVPYKKTVVPFIDCLSPTAKRLGAVNTVVKKNSLLYGYNTDVFGFTQLLLKNGAAVKNKLCVILGSGGAASAARAALEDLGAKQIIIVSRSGKIGYDALYSMPHIDLLINATPVGMFPEDSCSPVDLSRLKQVSYVVDMIYNPLETPLLFQANSLGIKCAGGLYMLVAQAVKSCELFYSRSFSDGLIDRVYGELIQKVRNTVLIGMPSCGKTHFGKLLSDALGVPFEDSDEIITRRLKRTPEEIIKTDGEEYFRKAEAEVIRELSRCRGRVIAVGGGAVCTPENGELLRKNSLVIFLERSLARLTSDGRPLSKQYGIEKLYEERLPLYKSFSHLTLCADDEEQALIKLKEYAKM